MTSVGTLPELDRAVDEVFDGLDRCENKKCEAVAEWLIGPPCGCRCRACTFHLHSYLRRMAAFTAKNGLRGTCTHCGCAGPAIPQWEPIR